MENESFTFAVSVTRIKSCTWKALNIKISALIMNNITIVCIIVFADSI